MTRSLFWVKLKLRPSFCQYSGVVNTACERCTFRFPRLVHQRTWRRLSLGPQWPAHCADERTPLLTVVAGENQIARFNRRQTCKRAFFQWVGRIWVSICLRSDVPEYGVMPPRAKTHRTIALDLCFAPVYLGVCHCSHESQHSHPALAERQCHSDSVCERRRRLNAGALLFDRILTLFE